MSAFNHTSLEISSYNGGNAQMQEENCNLINYLEKLISKTVRI